MPLDVDQRSTQSFKMNDQQEVTMIDLDTLVHRMMDLETKYYELQSKYQTLIHQYEELKASHEQLKSAQNLDKL